MATSWREFLCFSVGVTRCVDYLLSFHAKGCSEVEVKHAASRPRLFPRTLKNTLLHFSAVPGVGHGGPKNFDCRSDNNLGCRIDESLCGFFDRRNEHWFLITTCFQVSKACHLAKTGVMLFILRDTSSLARGVSSTPASNCPQRRCRHSHDEHEGAVLQRALRRRRLKRGRDEKLFVFCSSQRMLPSDGHALFENHRRVPGSSGIGKNLRCIFCRIDISN